MEHLLILIFELGFWCWDRVVMKNPKQIESTNSVFPIQIDSNFEWISFGKKYSPLFFHHHMWHAAVLQASWNQTAWLGLILSHR